MTALGNARGIARRTARGNAHVVCPRSRQSSIEGVAVGVDLPPVSQPPHAGDQGGGVEEGVRFTSLVDCEPREGDPPRAGREGSFPLPAPSPSPRRLPQGYCPRPMPGGEPRGTNRGGAFRMLACVNQRRVPKESPLQGDKVLPFACLCMGGDGRDSHLARLPDSQRRRRPDRHRCPDAERP